MHILRWWTAKSYKVNKYSIHSILHLHLMITLLKVDIVMCFYLFIFLGKRAETVRQMLQDIFEQAEWRQPSVILLDDLDHMTWAPTSPEHEHGAEALLQQHIAQSKLYIYYTQLYTYIFCHDT